MKKTKRYIKKLTEKEILEKFGAYYSCSDKEIIKSVRNIEMLINGIYTAGDSMGIVKKASE